MNKEERRKKKEGDSRRRRERGSPLPHPPHSCPEHGRRAILHSSSRLKREGGFTLIEVTIVALILMLLLLGTVLIIDPFEQIYRAQDGQRSKELGALDSAIRAVRSDIGGSFDPDSGLADSCVGEASQTVFVSVVGIDINGTCASPPSDLPADWAYRCAPNNGPQDADGTGWLPVDFSASSTTQFSNLPLDPENTFASGNYYTYVCSRTPTRFEVTARMKSDKFRTSGTGDVQSTDGGDDFFVFERGDDTSLNPLGPIALWDASAWDGVDTIPDNTGNGNAAVASAGGSTIPSYGTDSNGDYVFFDGVDDKLIVASNADLDFALNEDFTLMVWLSWDSTQVPLWPMPIGKKLNAGDLAGYNFILKTTENKPYFVIGSAVDTRVTEAGNANDLPFNTPVTLTGVRNAQTDIAGYVDGLLWNPARADTLTATLASSTDFVIGMDAAGTFPWKGKIYAVALWRRALTDAEIAIIEPLIGD